MTARQRGPLPPALRFLDADAPGHLALARVLRHAVKPATDQGIIDPLSARIVSEVHIRMVVPVYLLAATRARWNELRDVNPRSAVIGGIIGINASKGSKSRTVRIMPSVGGLDLRGVPRNPPLTIVSYDAICRAIKRAMLAQDLTLPHRSNSATHAFRHFWASWRASKGAQVADISAGLGHHNIESTGHYIHDIALLHRS